MSATSFHAAAALRAVEMAHGGGLPTYAATRRAALLF